MFKNKASSMVLNKKYTMLPCSPKLTFEIKHGLHKTEKLLQPLNLTKDQWINKSFTRFCLIMLSEIRLLKKRSLLLRKEHFGRNSCPQKS